MGRGNYKNFLAKNDGFACEKWARLVGSCYRTNLHWWKTLQWRNELNLWTFRVFGVFSFKKNVKAENDPVDRRAASACRPRNAVPWIRTFSGPHRGRTGRAPAEGSWTVWTPLWRRRRFLFMTHSMSCYEIEWPASSIPYVDICRPLNQSIKHPLTPNLPDGAFFF